MKIHFLGANRQVTGSRYCVEVGSERVMIDCGLFQERPYESRNWDACPIAAQSVAALLLTHVHTDHLGLLPKFVREGFQQTVYATTASVPLAAVMLRDAAHIQEEDAEYKRRRHAQENRSGPRPVTPLFTDADVDRTLPLFQGVEYGQRLQVTKSIAATFYDAGHILGSAMIELEVTENGKVERLLFSGDIGQWNKPIIQDPTMFTQADYVVMESTYGDREHQEAGDIETQFETIINATVARHGKVVIPTFAVERAQELMYYIGRLKHAGRIPPLKVFLDSPMAVDVTKIYGQFHSYHDEETVQLLEAGNSPLNFQGLELCRTIEQSKQINSHDQPCIIMATSGMCTSGRIKHHLRQTISGRENTILFVGYQAHGTLGRQILERPERVRIHGRDYPVRAAVAQIYGFSGHADRSDLLRWIGNLQSAPKCVFLTHGEEEAAKSLAEAIRKQHGWRVEIPAYQQVVELA